MGVPGEGGALESKAGDGDEQGQQRQQTDGSC